MTNKLVQINLALKTFILSLCLLNFTACSARKSTTRAIGKNSAARESSYAVKEDKTEQTHYTSSTNDDVNNSTKSFTGKEQDSSSAKIKNRISVVERFSTIIDSIQFGDGSKVYGIKKAEKRNLTDNSDILAKRHYNKEVASNDQSSSSSSDSDVTLNVNRDEKSEQSGKSKSHSNISNSLNTGEVVENWVWVVITSLFTAWWFWLLLAIIGYYLYKKYDVSNRIARFFNALKD